MTRWILALVAVLAGAAWWLTGETHSDPSVGGEESEPAVVALQRPVPPESIAQEPHALNQQADAEAGAGKPGPAGPGSGGAKARQNEVEATLLRAQVLVAAGQAGDARKLLKDALGQGRSDAEVGRLCLGLAAMEPDGHARRQLLGRALASGSVRGDEWDQVGGALRELSKQPRTSLHGLLNLETYSVRSGDSLWKICNKTLPKEFGRDAEPGLLRVLNGMSGNTVQAGQSLVIPKESLRLTVDRNEHGLVVWLGDVALAAYRIGLGRENRTPQGEFTINVKQENPDWYRDGRRIPYGDKENVLGTRWMGFENTPGLSGYGIHGTDQPESVGLSASDGCIRMRNAEVEELFELVPRGSVVTIP